MKAFQLLIITFLFPFILQAQGSFTYFNKLYDTGLSPLQIEAIYGDALFELKDGYVFIGVTRGYPSGSYSHWFVKTNFLGDTLWTKAHVDSNYLQYPQNAIRLDDGNYICLEIVAGIGEYYDVGIVKYNHSGGVVWRKQTGIDSLTDFSNQIIAAYDGGYAIAGQRSNGSDGDVYMLKVDSEGDSLWEREYGGPNYEAASSIVETDDKGFLLLGWTRSFGEGLRDWYLIKTDSLGNQEWQKTYGFGTSDSGLEIIKLSDGNYLMQGVYHQEMVLHKINPLGETIWEEIYRYPGGTSNFLYKIRELPNGDIVGAGSTLNFSESNAGWLIKIDSEGEMIWQRKYNNSDNVDMFYTFLSTTDGGYLLAGQIADTLDNTPDAWLLKVDAWGCPYANCVPIMPDGVNENENIILADVWPNPSSDILNVEWQNTELTTVALYNQVGELVYSKSTNNTKLQIDVSTLAQGLYYLSLLQEENKATVKVVVTH